MLVFYRHKLIWRSNLPGKKEKRINLFAPKVLSGRGFDYSLVNDAVYSSDKILWKGKKTDFFYIQGSVHCEIHVYANNCSTRCNYIQFVYICKPLYMFRVVSPPIIRSSCHYPLDGNCSSHPVTFTTGCSYGFTSARWGGCSDVSSWWLVGIPPEICRAVCRYKQTV